MNAATMRVLRERGLSVDDIIAVAEAMESKTDRTAAERQARYRAKRKGKDSNAVTSRRFPLKEDQNPNPDISPDGENQDKRTITKPDDVSEQVWSDFRQHRKAKRAPVTATVITQIRAEADKAGWTLEAVLARMVQRGWQGFEADWVKERTANGTGNHKKGGSTADSARRALEHLQHPA